MTGNVPNRKDRTIRRLLEEKRRLCREKNALTALCLLLSTALGVILILI